MDQSKTEPGTEYTGAFTCDLVSPVLKHRRKHVTAVLSGGVSQSTHLSGPKGISYTGL